jgi:hypothetical protein
MLKQPYRDLCDIINNWRKEAIIAAMDLSPKTYVDISYATDGAVSKQNVYSFMTKSLRRLDGLVLRESPPVTFRLNENGMAFKAAVQELRDFHEEHAIDPGKLYGTSNSKYDKRGPYSVMETLLSLDTEKTEWEIMRLTGLKFKDAGPMIARIVDSGLVRQIRSMPEGWNIYKADAPIGRGFFIDPWLITQEKLNRQRYSCQRFNAYILSPVGLEYRKLLIDAEYKFRPLPVSML